MREKETKREIEEMCPAQRCETAKTVLAGLNPRLIEAIGLNQANEIILFSDTLSKQIPESYAANAFNLFQDSLFRIEVITLCSLWDRADLDKHSIPLLRKLLDNEAVQDLLLQKHTAAEQEKPIGNNFDDHDVKFIRQSRKEQAHNDFKQSRTAFFNSDEKAESSVRQLRNLRHAYVHNFEDWRSATNEKSNADTQPKNKDVSSLLTQTKEVMRAANAVIENEDVAFDAFGSVWEDYTTKLWSNCTFNISNE